jgi:double zinc ribbon protein
MTAATSCPACGNPASGNFCSACGASLVPRTCAACRADLSPQARFCHRCGRPAAGAAAAGLPVRERTAWLVAGTLCVVLLALIVFKVVREAHPAAAPEMANAGAESAREGVGDDGGAGSSGATPPDISRMTPRERFDRLFNRVMQAGERGDTAQVVRFTPMALGAYAQLDSADADARYHAAVLRMQIGDLPGALALADTILARSPGHLFGYIVRGTVAKFQNDTARRLQAERDFRAHFAAESAAGRPEYLEHQPAIDEFRRSATTER